jgi:signal transduction histidine kinase
VSALFSQAIADRLEAEHRALALRWLERLTEIVPEDVHSVFPSDQLLDHIPMLIREIGAYLRAPAAEAIGANTHVIAKAQELGLLRHEQQASVHQLLREYRLLGDVLVHFVEQETKRLALAPGFEQVMELMSGLHRAVAVLMQTTVETFITEYSGTIEKQTARLEGFNRMVSHELRQPLSALSFTVAVLRKTEDLADAARLRRLVETLDRNVSRLTDLISKLATLSRLIGEEDHAHIQRVDLGLVAADVARQLKDMADARGVEIRVGEGLPEVTADIGSIELILINLVSNAIKYSDSAALDRHVEIEAASAEEGFVALAVRDNGIGIDRAHLPSVFDRFYRAHTAKDGESEIDGLGLGLAIVRDCVHAIGGRIAVDSTRGVGTTFLVTIPVAPVAH